MASREVSVGTSVKAIQRCSERVLEGLNGCVLTAMLLHIVRVPSTLLVYFVIIRNMSLCCLNLRDCCIKFTHNHYSLNTTYLKVAVKALKLIC